MDREVQKIIIRAREDVYGYLNGSNISNILGEGYDFAELREYSYGDDIKHISWISTAKLGKPYVKKMYEERDLNIVVASLIDGRFVVGDKLKTISYIAGVLGYSTHILNSILYPILISKEDRFYEPTKDMELIDRYIEDIYSSNLLASSLDYSKISTKLLNRVYKKSLIFILGDFLDPIDLSILSQKHEVIAIIVRDRFEDNPTPMLNSELIDPRTNRAVNQTLTKRAIAEYKKRLKEHDNRLFFHLDSNNIKYTKIYSIDEVIKKLEGLFFLKY